MSDKLKPCPFCGGEDIGISRIYIDPLSDPLSSGRLPDEVYVGCISCGIGFTEETEEEAIKAWNRRPK